LFSFLEALRWVFFFIKLAANGDGDASPSQYPVK
jgi:hypothetical protein